MALERTAPLREALAEALPDRPFSLHFWDGTELAGTAPGPVGRPSAGRGRRGAKSARQPLKNRLEERFRRRYDQ